MASLFSGIEEFTILRCSFLTLVANNYVEVAFRLYSYISVSTIATLARATSFRIKSSPTNCLPINLAVHGFTIIGAVEIEDRELPNSKITFAVACLLTSYRSILSMFCAQVN